MVNYDTLIIGNGIAFAHFTLIFTRTALLSSAVLILPTRKDTLSVFLVLTNKLGLNSSGVDALVVKESLNLVGNAHVFVWRSASDVGRR